MPISQVIRNHACIPGDGPNSRVLRGALDCDAFLDFVLQSANLRDVKLRTENLSVLPEDLKKRLAETLFSCGQVLQDLSHSSSLFFWGCWDDQAN